MIVNFQSYPVPTELPPMHEGEIDARYMDCTPALGPVGDVFISIASIGVICSRQDGRPITGTDLVLAPLAWPSTLDDTGRIVTLGWQAPFGSGGVAYLLILTAPTREGRIFVRTWTMSIIPAL